jgi:hypothetical protein
LSVKIYNKTEVGLYFEKANETMPEALLLINAVYLGYRI